MKLPHALPALLAAIALASPSLLSAESPTPGDLVARLKRSAATSSLDDPTLKPWHLKLSIQLYDMGKPTEQGSIEEWWAGAQSFKIVYDTPSFHSTELSTPEGLYRTTRTGEVPYLLQSALTQAVHPMPSVREIEAASPEEEVKDIGKIPLDCLMLSKAVEGSKNVPLGLYPTYCLDHGKDTLRTILLFGAQATVRERLGVFQGKSLAVDQAINANAIPLISEHIDLLRAEALSPSDLQPGPELERVSSGASYVAGSAQAGRVISQIAPIYPETARRAHISGTVLMSAVIARDGHVRDLSVIFSPDTSLSKAAQAAARQWTYTPYLLNGAPVEVRTTIKVSFNFGPGRP